MAKLDKLKIKHVLARLAESIKGYYGYFYGAWIAVAIEVGCEVTIPFMMQPMIDNIRLLGGGNDAAVLSTIWMYAGIMAGLAVCSTCAGIAGGFFASIASAGFGTNLRKSLYYQIQEFSFENIDKFSVSSLVTRMTTDVTNAQQALQMILRMVVRGPLMLILAFVMASITEIRLSWIFLVAVPILGFALVFITIKTHPIFYKVFTTYDKLNESVKENLEGIRVVKTFNREDFENEKFGKISWFIYKNFAKAEKLIALNNPIMQAVVNSCILAICIGGALLIVQGRYVVTGGSYVEGSFTTGELTSFFTYTMQILMSLNFMTMGFVMVIIARNSCERIVEVLDEKSSITSKENAIKEVKDGSIEFKHVYFRYSASGSKDVLHDISFKMASGSSLGIIGQTGSSKTTLISMINRLYDVNEGEVKVGGINVKDYDLKNLRDSVATVLQKNTLFSGTIASNLRWGNEEASVEEMDQACEIAQAKEFVDRLPEGFDAIVEEGGNNFSGGQKQRLCIARAVIKKPKVLILDDSTSAVDTATDAKIRKAFMEQLPGMSRIIVAQRILSIKDCDQIMVLDDGKLVDIGTNDELLSRCLIYKEIYETQMGGGDFDEQ